MSKLKCLELYLSNKEWKTNKERLVNEAKNAYKMRQIKNAYQI
jgi:tRNA A22 N-methylase